MSRFARGLAIALACSTAGACTAEGPVPPPAAAKAEGPQCPAGSAWNGAHCVHTVVVNEVTCPAGSTWDGARCVGNLVADCPAGTRFVDGVGCVAEFAFDAQPPPSATAQPLPPVPPRPTCGCASSDLMCLMKCAAVCKDGTAKPCQSQIPPSNTGRAFDRAAAVATLAAASAAAKSCTGLSGTGRFRINFAPSGLVSSAYAEGPPFAGTAQGACITAVLRKEARVPAFDGADVAVSKTISIP